MTCNDRHHPLFCVVPPHLFEHIAAHSHDEGERELAVQMLSSDHSIRSFRTIEELGHRDAVTISGPALAAHRQRYVYDTNSSTNLPGTLARSEGDGPTGDAAVDEAYDWLGATFDLYWDVFSRNSIDNAGLDLRATAHYDANYDNAFWNGTQMVFGDGDGTYFNRFTIAADVVGHELTHGVTGYTARLEYHDQPGALNESISDVFGSLVKQYHLHQTAAQADWLIGEGLFTARVNGKALRSMKAPGTAYDDPVLGTDPQPDHMSRFVHTTSDNGGVHINSGIPNKAFYLTAIGLGGQSWDKAGPIWYAALTGGSLAPGAQFVDFANLTVLEAERLYDDATAAIVTDAWHQVGIDVTTASPKVSGNWTLHFSWGATGHYAQTAITFNSNGTFGGSLTGRWHQQDGTLLLSFDTGPAKYAGTVDSQIGTGAMSTFAGLDGAWYLSKVGTVGIAPALTELRAGAVDAAGTMVVARDKVGALSN